MSHQPSRLNGKLKRPSDSRRSISSSSSPSSSSSSPSAPPSLISSSGNNNSPRPLPFAAIASAAASNSSSSSSSSSSASSSPSSLSPSSNEVPSDSGRVVDARDSTLRDPEAQTFINHIYDCVVRRRNRLFLVNSQNTSLRKQSLDWIIKQSSKLPTGFFEGARVLWMSRDRKTDKDTKEISFRDKVTGSDKLSDYDVIILERLQLKSIFWSFFESRAKPPASAERRTLRAYEKGPPVIVIGDYKFDFFDVEPKDEETAQTVFDLNREMTEAMFAVMEVFGDYIGPQTLRKIDVYNGHSNSHSKSSLASSSSS